VTGVIAIGLLGCGGAAPPSKPQPPDSASNATPVEKPSEGASKETANVGKPPAPPEIDPKSAAAAILKTLQALEAGNLADAYDFLPPAYQSDLDGLLHEFADRMDPEVWSRLIGTARKGIEVLRTKKDFIMALDLFRDRPEVEPYRKHWDSTLQLAATFAQSDAAELSKLKQATARALLPGRASPMLQQFDAIGLALGANLARQFAGVTVTPVRTEGAEQIVALRGPNDEQPTEIAYVQVDGHWLPKSLVEHWNEGIAADREWLEKLPGRIKTVKPRLLEALSQADDILDQLQAAENREQFEQAAGPAILSLAAAWPNLQSLARQAVAGQGGLPHVTISINRELTERELSKLVETILKPLQESGANYTLLANDSRTICRLTRISDVASLRESLASYFSIPADDVKFDREAAAITVELAP
jgi:hypothetical protein